MLGAHSRMPGVDCTAITIGAGIRSNRDASKGRLILVAGRVHFRKGRLLRSDRHVLVNIECGAYD